MVVSKKLNFMALAIPFLSFVNFLVRTREECRYKLCGMTVAPIIPIAIYKAPVPGREGMSPVTNSEISGLEKNSSITKETPMMLISPMIIASSIRIPLFTRNIIIKVSNKERVTPTNIFKPKSRYKPIAMPRTSARSVAAIAISAKIQKTKFNLFG